MISWGNRKESTPTNKTSDESWKIKTKPRVINGQVKLKKNKI